MLTKVELKAINSVREFIECNEELMRDLDDNHVEIIFTKDDVKIDGCKHD